MSPSVTMRIEVPRGHGTSRQLEPGQCVVLGRVSKAAGIDRVNIPGLWLGVGLEAMVPDELLAISYTGWSAGHATIEWHTGPGCDPASLRVATATAAGHGQSAAAGRLLVGESSSGRLLVSRFNVQTDRFVQRLTIDFRLTDPAADVAHDWSELVTEWWRPRREPKVPGSLTWQISVALTFRLAADAPPGRLAHIVAQGLQRRGYQHATVIRVRSTWNRAMLRLCRVLSEPDRQWMVDRLAIPGLAEYLERVQAGDPTAWVPAGERTIRSLRLALRATGRPEWQ